MCQSPWQRDFYWIWSCVGFFENTGVNPSLLLPLHFYFLFSLMFIFLIAHPSPAWFTCHFTYQRHRSFLTTVRSHPNIINRPFVNFEWEEKFSSSSCRSWLGLNRKSILFSPLIFIKHHTMLTFLWGFKWFWRSSGWGEHPPPIFPSFSPWPLMVLLPHHCLQKKVTSWVKVHSGPFPKHRTESALLPHGKSVIQQWSLFLTCIMKHMIYYKLGPRPNFYS